MSSRRKKECKDCDCKASYQQFIKKQFLRIEELENEISILRMERDSLLHENERILFNLQMISLKHRTEEASYVQDEKRKQLPPASIHTNGERKMPEIYELSQEMMDKRVEMMVRKYGKESVKAALIIQKAFRKYQLNKRFKNLALNALRVNNHEKNLLLQQQQLQLQLHQPQQQQANQQQQEQHELVSSIAGKAEVTVIGCSIAGDTGDGDSSQQRLTRTCSSSTKRYSNASLQSSCSSTSSSTTHSTYNNNNNTVIITTTSVNNKPPPLINANHSNGTSNHHTSYQSNGYNNCSTGIPRSPTMPSLQSSSLSSTASRLVAKKANQTHGGSASSMKTSVSTSSFPHRSPHYDVMRAREYRVGLNLFNKNPPERGIQYLFEKGFIDDIIDESKLLHCIGSGSVAGDGDLEQERKALRVALFLLTKKGLSKQMIGEYLGDLQSPFNQLVLKHFVREMDFTAMLLDIALRKFQTYFRFPGEAQKIERLVETFSERYTDCNAGLELDRRQSEETSILVNKDDVFILSFAIIMLNTDLHVPNNKNRMTCDQWIKNLRGVVKSNLTEDFLTGIYERIKQAEMKTGHDHCLQVLKVQCSLVASSRNVTVPNLCANTYRRLICFCRLHEIVDLNKKERQGQHQREVFLFNDLLLVTKVYKKGGSRTSLQNHLGANSVSSQLYSYRRSILLTSVNVSLFSTHYYPYGIKISSRMEKDKTLILFNARNDTDRFKFFEDLKESIAEMHQMEMIRIQSTIQTSNGSSSPSPSSASTSSAKRLTAGVTKSNSNSTTATSKTTTTSTQPNSNHSSLLDLSSSNSSSPSSSYSSPKSGLLASHHSNPTVSSSLDSVLPPSNSSKNSLPPLPPSATSGTIESTPMTIVSSTTITVTTPGATTTTTNPMVSVTTAPALANTHYV